MKIEPELINSGFEKQSGDFNSITCGKFIHLEMCDLLL
jgi:hypothetical protein